MVITTFRLSKKNCNSTNTTSTPDQALINTSNVKPRNNSNGQLSKDTNRTSTPSVASTQSDPSTIAQSPAVPIVNDIRQNSTIKTKSTIEQLQPIHAPPYD